MDKHHIRIRTLDEIRQQGEDDRFWETQSPEDRLRAVEILRRQYGKLAPGKGYACSKGFEEFFASFNARNVLYLVVGGYAIAFHARPRFTGDLDVFVLANEGNARKIILALADFGFTLPEPTWKELTTPANIVQLGYPPHRIDIMTAIDGVVFDEAWGRRVISQYGNQRVHFISKEDLIAHMRVSGRKQDLIDLEFLTQN